MTMTFEEWMKKKKTGASRDIVDTVNFERSNPYAAEIYRQRREEEAQKRREIMAIKDRDKRLKAISENIRIFN